jgi:hypothetical protein
VLLLLLRRRREVELPLHFRRAVCEVRARWCEAFVFGLRPGSGRLTVGEGA